MSNELSPAAQAVLTLVLDQSASPSTELRARLQAADLLRTVADQVVPDNYESFTGHIEWDQGMEARNDSVRDNLLSIASELTEGY